MFVVQQSRCFGDDVDQYFSHVCGSFLALFCGRRGSLFPASIVGYFDTCFLHMQHAIDMAIITSLKPGVKVTLRMRVFPRPPYVDDSWGVLSVELLSMSLFVIFLLYVMTIAKDVTNDKESKMRVCMAKADSTIYKYFP